LDLRLAALGMPDPLPGDELPSLERLTTNRAGTSNAQVRFEDLDGDNLVANPYVAVPLAGVVAVPAVRAQLALVPV
jgi:hypothetical protein